MGYVVVRLKLGYLPGILSCQSLLISIISCLPATPQRLIEEDLFSTSFLAIPVFLGLGRAWLGLDVFASFFFTILIFLLWNLDRDIPVFFGRPCFPFGAEHLQGAYELGPRVPG